MTGPNTPLPDPVSSSPEPETPYARALAARSIAPLTGSAESHLLDDMESRMSTADVSLELAALRLILYRLMTEHHDLPSLTTLMTRVVTVALHAARTSHHVRQQDSTDLLDAISTILQEIGGNQ